MRVLSVIVNMTEPRITLEWSINEELSTLGYPLIKSVHGYLNLVS